MIGSREETAEMDVDVDQEIQNQLEEAWRRRPNGGVGILDGPGTLYWIEISDREDTGDTGDARETGVTTENKAKKFCKLTPHNAFRLVSKFINPLKGGLYRKKDGKFCAQIPRVEVDLVLKIVNFGDIKVAIKKDQFANRSRGIVWHPDIKLMPEDEILESLKEQKVSKVIKKMRYNKNSNSREISGELVLHFDSDKLPDEIRLDYLLLKVNQYVPIPPLCNNCYAVV